MIRTLDTSSSLKRVSSDRLSASAIVSQSCVRYSIEGATCPPSKFVSFMKTSPNCPANAPDLQHRPVLLSLRCKLLQPAEGLLVGGAGGCAFISGAGGSAIFVVLFKCWSCVTWKDLVRAKYLLVFNMAFGRVGHLSGHLFFPAKFFCSPTTSR